MLLSGCPDDQGGGWDAVELLFWWSRWWWRWCWVVVLMIKEVVEMLLSCCSDVQGGGGDVVEWLSWWSRKCWRCYWVHCRNFWCFLGILQLHCYQYPQYFMWLTTFEAHFCHDFSSYVLRSVQTINKGEVVLYSKKSRRAWFWIWRWSLFFAPYFSTQASEVCLQVGFSVSWHQLKPYDTSVYTFEYL